MKEHLLAELNPLAREAAGLGGERLRLAEARFARIVDAFRDRLTRNIHEATGITISPASRELRLPEVGVAPVAVSTTFMIHWDLLWWLLPMTLVGGVFRRHLFQRLTREVEKNLIRLTGELTQSLDQAIADLRTQAVSWTETELTTLRHLLNQRPAEGSAFRDALARLPQPDPSASA